MSTMELITKKFKYQTETGYMKGKFFIRHCDNGPAIVRENGEEMWYTHGVLNREDGPAVVIKKSYYKKYIRSGQLHRDDGPAYISSDGKTQRWYMEGNLHREDGPAIISHGKEKYFIQGVGVSEKAVLNPQDLTIDEMLSIDNQEEKRINIERFGWIKFLEISKAEIIDSGKNEIEQTHEFLAKVQDMVILVGACPSTGRVYPMEVPPETTNRSAAREYLTNKNPARCVGAT